MPFDYIPLSDNEIDVVHKMVDGQELYVEVVGWGYHPSPKIIAGDKRIQVRFPLEFNRPDFSVPVHYFDIALKLRNGREVYKDRLPVSDPYQGGPVMITAGVLLDMVWDISVGAISPDFLRYMGK
jgi:hypothetical protein